MRQTDKFLSLLGMARRANRVSLGYEQALDAIHSGKCYVVFTASDLSEKTSRGLVFASEETKTVVRAVDYTMHTVSDAVGQKTGIVAVNDAGFGKRLLQLLNTGAVTGD